MDAITIMNTFRLESPDDVVFVRPLPRPRPTAPPRSASVGSRCYRYDDVINHLCPQSSLRGYHV
jgi:hypothetical protein